MTEAEKLAEAMTKRLAEEGRLIEMGWVGLRLLAIPHVASERQVSEMRMAFMAGAQHLFSSIMVMLDPEDEVSPADLRKLDLINRELEAFGAELKARLGAPANDTKPRR